MRKVMRTNNFIKTLSISLILIFGLALSIIASINTKSTVSAGNDASYGVDATTQTTMSTWNTSWIDHYLNTGDNRDPRVYEVGASEDTLVDDSNAYDGNINIGGTDYNISAQTLYKKATINSYSLPVEYTQLEYLQSTGTQYINTGYAHTANTHIDMKVAIPSLYNFNTFYGSCSGDNSIDSFTLGVNGSGGLNCDITNGINPISGTSGKIVANQTHSIQLSAQKAVIDGVSYSTGITTGVASTYTDAIFMRNVANSYGNEAGQAKVYYLIIYDGDTMVRYFVPAKRNSDSVYGMYDLVNNQFYPGQGSGTFIVGEEVSNINTDNGIYYISSNDVYKDGAIVATINSNGEFTYNSHDYIVENNQIFQRLYNNSDVFVGTVTSAKYFKIDNQEYYLDFVPQNSRENGWIKYFKYKYYSEYTDDSLVDVYKVSNLSDIGLNADNSIGITGAGTQNDPYLINNVEQLAYVAYMMRNNTRYESKSGGTYQIYNSKYFKVTSDLDLSGHYWESIGYWTGNERTRCFANFDFDNHTISNLYSINKSDYSTYAGGLFDVMYGSIKNLTIDTAYCEATSGSYSGVLAAQISNTNVSNVKIKHATLNGAYNWIGIVAGYTNGTQYQNIEVDDCLVSCIGGDYQRALVFGTMRTASINNVKVKASKLYFTTNSYYVGGIAGYTSNVTITNAYLDSDTLLELNSYYIGGIVGDAVGTINISNSVNKATINNINTGNSCTGGIIGLVDDASGGSVINCENYGTITAQHWYCGGIIGMMSPSSSGSGFTVSYCNNYGTLSGKYSGGIVGYVRYYNPNQNNSVTITSCTNYGAVSSNNDSIAGGIVGLIESYKGSIDNTGTCFNNIKWSACPIYVTKCANNASVTSTSSNVAGIVGYINSVSTTISDCKNTGAISGTSAIGGIVGYWTNGDYDRFLSNSNTNANYITRCYNTGNVTTTNSSITVCNFVGNININANNKLDRTAMLNITECFASSNVPTSGYNLFTVNYTSSTASAHPIIVDNVYVYDTTHPNKNYIIYYGSNQNNTTIDSYASSKINFTDSVNRLDPSMIYTESTFVGFDFNNNWGFNLAQHNGLPYLLSIDAITITAHTLDGNVVNYLYRSESYNTTTQEVTVNANGSIALSTISSNATTPLCKVVDGYATSPNGTKVYNDDDTLTISSTSYTYETLVSNKGSKTIDLYPIYTNADVRNYKVQLTGSEDTITYTYNSGDNEITVNVTSNTLIYYRSSDNKLGIKVGDNVVYGGTMTVNSGLNQSNFANWQVYKSSSDQYDTLNETNFGTNYAKEFDLLTLIQALDSKDLDNYIYSDSTGDSLGIIGLRSVPMSTNLKAIVTYEIADGEVYINGELLASNTERNMVLYYINTFVVNANDYRYIKSIQLTPEGESTVSVWSNDVQQATTYTIDGANIKLNDTVVETIANNQFTLGTSNYTIDGNSIKFGNYVIATISNNQFTINPQSFTFTYKALGGVNITVIYEDIDYAVNFTPYYKERTSTGGLNASEIFTTNNVTVKNGSYIEEFNVVVPNKWQFVEWSVKNYNTGAYDVLGASTDLTGIMVNDTFLDNYMRNNQVTLYASFTKLYTIKVQVQKENDVANGTFKVYKDNTSNDITTQYTTNGVFNATFTESTLIYIIVIPNTDYIINNVTGLGNVALSGESATLSLDSDKDITISYQQFEYEIVLKAYNTGGSVERNYADDSKIYVNDIECTKVAKGQSLTKLVTDTTNATHKHRFDNYQIWDNDAQAFVAFNIGNITTNGNIVSTSGQSILIDDAFVAKYVKNDQILIRTIYCLQYLVSASVQDADSTMGTFDVEIYNGETLIETKTKLTTYSEYLDKGLKVKLIANANKGFEFVSYIPTNGTYDTEAQSIIFNVSQARTVSLKFETEKFTLNMANLTFSGGEIEITANNMPMSDDKLFTNIEVGDQIIVSFKPQMGYEVNTFTINKKNITELPGAVLESNTLTLTVTSELLDMLNSTNDIDVNVSASLATMYLAILIGAPTLLLLIVVIIIINIIGNNRLRAQVKARLNAEFTQNMKFDSAGMIKGLKQGKAVGQVTDEDIKREMKNEKKKKK